ncbi:MAG: sporulation protein YunB [Oscillospiraceae bacterium]|jgi:sporulation protein YunB|nr:sporulation protein YunB [Oscillospiraceae bacterium]
MRSLVLRRGFAQMRAAGPQTASARAGIILITLAVIISAVGALFFARVRPIVAILAKAAAREYVTTAINDAVESEISAGRLRYDEIVTLEKDDSGAITALVTDMAKINILQSRVSNAVARNVVNVMSEDMAVPIGDAIGGIIFSGRGPKVPIRVESVTDISAQIGNDFSSGGINQTRHKITLAISAEIVILIPGGRTTAVVTSEIAIAETIIIGTVPNVYATY